MDKFKTRSIEKIESKMGGVEKDSLRYHILESAKNFKTSWIQLGQALYSVWKDKSYKEWGYLTFDAYTSKEIGIKKPTAVKLLKSYYFLEKEEPSILRREYSESARPSSLPSYESVNLLRLAKMKALDGNIYTRLKADVLERGVDAGEVRKGLTAIIRERDEAANGEEARKKRRFKTVKRLVATLKTLRNDVEVSRLLSAEILKETSSLIRKIESEIDNSD